MNTGLPPADWDQALAKINGSILQSRVWAQFQAELGRQPSWDRGAGWMWLAHLRQSHGLRYLLASYGPAAVGEREMGEAISSLVSAGRELGTDFVRIEPQNYAAPRVMQKYGARRIAELDPEHNSVIDLSLSEEQLRSNLASGHRNLINGTQRRGISIRISDQPNDFNEFLKMLADTAKRSKVTFYSNDYYQNLWQALQPQGALKLYVADHEAKPVAAALFYDWQGTRYYAHAGAYQLKNRQVKASVSLVWQAILDAKQAGMTHFDLWGVAPEGDSSHRLAPLSRFKDAFGGARVNYGGTYDIPLKKPKYAAYSVYRKLRGMD